MDSGIRQSMDTARIERQVRERAGLDIIVEEEDGVITLSGVVDSAEARQAAAELAGRVAPGKAIDNALEVEVRLPADMEDLAVGELRSEQDGDGPDETDELQSDFPGLPISPEEDDVVVAEEREAAYAAQAAGDEAEEDEEVYSPPTDPVVTVGAHGQVEVLGGFSNTSMDSLEVDESAEDALPGDEALADAVRRELREDAATTDLDIRVRVQGGVVELRGRVSGPEDADSAEEVAARVPGVQEVVEALDLAGLEKERGRWHSAG